MSKPRLLIVDDDPLIAESVAFYLQRDFDIVSAASRPAAVDAARQQSRLDAALIDLGLPPRPHRPDEGYQLIGELLAHAPDIRIVVLSGQDAERSGRHARALGAVDFIPKPADPQELRKRLLAALALPRATSGTLLGESLPMRQLKALIRQFADAPFPVLITGESGSGKEVVAQEVHHLSPRHAQSLLVLNCATLAPAVVEAMLFGQSEDTTGTTGRKAQPGLFEEASDGTLFLDEIGELPLELQPKLLRVLENGEYQRIGDPQPRRAQVRIIAATNRDLREAVKAGSFRADLYHRLSVFTINVPPLRTLGDDRTLLLDHYSKETASTTGLPPFTLSPAARQRWLSYSFPGNVRELRNIILRLAAKYPARRIGAVELEAELDLEAERMEGDNSQARRLNEATENLKNNGGVSLDSLLQSWERAYIDAAQALAGGNMAQAARMLGVNRTTLYNRIEVLKRNTPKGHAD